MPTYTYGDYVYFNNIIDAPIPHYNKFILDQEPYFNTTSLSNLMDETWTLLHKLFVNKMIKEWMNKHISVVAQLSNFVKRNKENRLIESM